MLVRLTGSAVLALLVGCASDLASNTNEFVIKARTTPFFIYGPAQSRGADFALPKDTQVTMLKREFGYSQVRMASGQTGYVANDDLAPAPERPPAPKQKKSSRGRVQSESEFVPPTRLPDEQLPGEPGAPAPSFRY